MGAAMTDAEVMVMARHIARKRIMDELRKSGIRLSLVEMSEVCKATNMLLVVCRDELLAEAKRKLS